MYIGTAYPTFWPFGIKSRSRRTVDARTILNLKKRQIRNANPLNMDKFVHSKANSHTLAYNIYRKKIAEMQSVQKLLRKIQCKKNVLGKHELYHHILKYLSYLASRNCYKYWWIVKIFCLLNWKVNCFKIFTYSILKNLWFTLCLVFIPTASEKDFNVKTHFNHRLIHANLQECCMTFQL